jgi:hypothetical protein
MSCGNLYRVALVRTDISENILPPSSGFLRMTGLTVELLLISLSIEGYYVWSKDTSSGMFSLRHQWQISSETLYRVALVRTDVSVNISLINSDSTVKQLKNHITLRNPENGGDIFSETSVLTRVTRQKVPEDIYHWYRRDNIPKDSVIGPYIRAMEFLFVWRFGPQGHMGYRLRVYWATEILALFVVKFSHQSNHWLHESMEQDMCPVSAFMESQSPWRHSQQLGTRRMDTLHSVVNWIIKI